MERAAEDEQSPQGFVSIGRFGDAIRLSVKLLFYGIVYQSALSLNYRDQVIKYWMITFCALMFYAYYENSVENASIAKKMLGFVLVEQMLAQNMTVITFGEAEDVLTRFDIEWERISGNTFFQKLEVETIMKAAQNSCPDGLVFSGGRVPKLSIVDETILRNCRLGLPMILTSASIRDRLLNFRSFIKQQKNLSAKAIANYLLFAFAGFTVTVGTMTLNNLYALLASVAVNLKTTIQKIWTQIKNFLTGHRPDDLSQHLFVLVNPNDLEQISPNKYVYKKFRYQPQGFTKFADTETELFELTYEFQPDKSTKQVLHKIVRGLIQQKGSISLTETGPKINDKLYDAFAQTKSFVKDLNDSQKEKDNWFYVTFDDKEKKVKLIPFFSESPEYIENSQKLQPSFNFVTVVENRELTPRPFPLWLVQNFPTEGINTEFSCKEKRDGFISVDKVWQYFPVDTKTFLIVTKPTQITTKFSAGTTLIIEYCSQTPYNILRVDWSKNQKRFQEVNVENRQFNDALDQYVADRIEQNGNLLDFVLAMIIDDFNLGVNITQNDKVDVQDKDRKLTQFLTKFQLKYFENDTARTILMNFVRPNVFEYNKLSVAVLQNSKITNESFLNKMFELRNTREEKRKMTKEETSVWSQFSKHNQELTKFVSELDDFHSIAAKVSLVATNQQNDPSILMKPLIETALNKYNDSKNNSNLTGYLRQQIPILNVFELSFKLLPDLRLSKAPVKVSTDSFITVPNPSEKGRSSIIQFNLKVEPEKIPANQESIFTFSLLYFEREIPSCNQIYSNPLIYAYNAYQATQQTVQIMQDNNISQTGKYISDIHLSKDMDNFLRTGLVDFAPKYLNSTQRVFGSFAQQNFDENEIASIVTNYQPTRQSLSYLGSGFYLIDHTKLQKKKDLEEPNTLGYIKLPNGKYILQAQNPYRSEMLTNQNLLEIPQSFVQTVYDQYNAMEYQFKNQNKLRNLDVLIFGYLFEFNQQYFKQFVDNHGGGFPIISKTVEQDMLTVFNLKVHNHTGGFPAASDLKNDNDFLLAEFSSETDKKIQEAFGTVLVESFVDVNFVKIIEDWPTIQNDNKKLKTQFYSFEGRQDAELDIIANDHYNEQATLDLGKGFGLTVLAVGFSFVGGPPGIAAAAATGLTGTTAILSNAGKLWVNGAANWWNNEKPKIYVLSKETKQLVESVVKESTNTKIPITDGGESSKFKAVSVYKQDQQKSFVSSLIQDTATQNAELLNNPKNFENLLKKRNPIFELLPFSINLVTADKPNPDRNSKALMVPAMQETFFKVDTNKGKSDIFQFNYQSYLSAEDVDANRRNIALVALFETEIHNPSCTAHFCNKVRFSKNMQTSNKIVQVILKENEDKLNSGNKIKIKDLKGQGLQQLGKTNLLEILTDNSQVLAPFSQRLFDLETVLHITKNFKLTRKSCKNAISGLYTLDANELAKKNNSEPNTLGYRQVPNGKYLLIAENPYETEMRKNQFLQEIIQSFVQFLLNEYSAMEEQFKINHRLRNIDVLILAHMFEFNERFFSQYLDEAGSGFPVLDYDTINEYISVMNFQNAHDVLYANFDVKTDEKIMAAFFEIIRDTFISVNDFKFIEKWQYVKDDKQKLIALFHSMDEQRKVDVSVVARDFYAKEYSKLSGRIGIVSYVVSAGAAIAGSPYISSAAGVYSVASFLMSGLSYYFKNSPKAIGDTKMKVSFTDGGKSFKPKPNTTDDMTDDEDNLTVKDAEQAEQLEYFPKQIYPNGPENPGPIDDILSTNIEKQKKKKNLKPKPNTTDDMTGDEDNLTVKDAEQAEQLEYFPKQIYPNGPEKPGPIDDILSTDKEKHTKKQKTISFTTYADFWTSFVKNQNLQKLKKIFEQIDLSYSSSDDVTIENLTIQLQKFLLTPQNKSESRMFAEKYLSRHFSEPFNDSQAIKVVNQYFIVPVLCQKYFSAILFPGRNNLQTFVSNCRNWFQDRLTEEMKKLKGDIIFKGDILWWLDLDFYATQDDDLLINTLQNFQTKIFNFRDKIWCFYNYAFYRIMTQEKRLKSVQFYLDDSDDYNYIPNEKWDQYEAMLSPNGSKTTILENRAKAFIKVMYDTDVVDEISKNYGTLFEHVDFSFIFSLFKFEYFKKRISQNSQPVMDLIEQITQNFSFMKAKIKNLDKKLLQSMQVFAVVDLLDYLHANIHPDDEMEKIQAFNRFDSLQQKLMDEISRKAIEILTEYLDKQTQSDENKTSSKFFALAAEKFDLVLPELNSTSFIHNLVQQELLQINLKIAGQKDAESVLGIKSKLKQNKDGSLTPVDPGSVLGLKGKMRFNGKGSLVPKQPKKNEENPPKNEEKSFFERALQGFGSNPNIIY